MAYVPDRGDVVRISLDPQAGREQAGRRPGVVMSPRTYNERVGLAVICPITRKAKGYPFEIVIPEGYPVVGVVLADQVKSLDWRVRDTEPWCKFQRSFYEVILDQVIFLMTP
jgi:mRNA interferase MazF